MSGKPGQKSDKATEIAERFGEDFLESMDGRGRTVRTLRQRLGALVSDLGGAPHLSYQEKSLCKRFVHIERLIERKESTLAHGGNIVESDYLNAINTLSGLCSKIGMKRRAKPTTSLPDYLESFASATEPVTENSPLPQGDA